MADSNVRSLPSVNAVLAHACVRPLLDQRGRHTVLDWTRTELDRLRRQMLAGESMPDRPGLLEQIARNLVLRSEAARQSRIGRVINATGVILHTGLGRAVLSSRAISALADAAGACNLEIDLDANRRSYRGHQLLSAWQAVTGCEDALVVNNNAAATLLTLTALARDREVVISRGQLIEIGGSFRLPEIFSLSGARLREVGTTNRTRLSDYERAVGADTAAIMHVHPSNYRVVGFAASPDIAELADLAHAHGLIAIDDIGSGAVVDVVRMGLPREPTFSASLSAGADLVLGSGDKLFGGPQAGIILGKREPIARIRQHPLARAVRVGKLTLAALSATLDAYQRGTAQSELPTLTMLTASVDSLLERAAAIKQQVEQLPGLDIVVRRDMATVGGGSLPGVELATAVLAVSHAVHSAETLSRQLRLGEPRIVCRVQQDSLLLDLRSVLPEDDLLIAEAFQSVSG